MLVLINCISVFSNQKKRMKTLQKKKQFGGKINEDNPFESFIGSTQISYCYYKDSERILGNTFGMLVLQDFEALTPNLLARTIETVEGGGLIVLLLHTIDSLKQLYTLSMDVHNRYRTEGNQDIVPRFNERFLLSLSSCSSCMVIDDRLNILPVSSHLFNLAALPKPENINELTPEQQELLDRKNGLQDVQPLGALANLCKTVDQLKALNEFFQVLQDKVSKATVSLTAARGRGKSATLGLAIAAAIANGYSSVYLTSPSPENLKTLYEFILKGFEAVNLKQHTDYEIIYLKDETNGKLISKINIYRDHRQTIQYVHPSEINENNRCNAELVVIDEAAAIPLPIIKAFFGPYLTFLASTINGYEGTGRSLSFKLLKQLKTQDLSSTSNEGFMNQVGKKFVEITIDESIRYSPDDEIEKWLYHLLCLDANLIDSVTISNYPIPDDCELYYINRDTLFSYHSVSEQFLQNLVSLYTSSHYKNSPNDLQMISDAPAHHLFCLLAPINESKLKRKGSINGKLPEVLVFIQVALEGKISQQTILNNLQRGQRGSGDLIPWTLSQQFDDNFASLSGARIVRIATHPKCSNKGYGTRALQLLEKYYKGLYDQFGSSDNEAAEQNELNNENLEDDNIVDTNEEDLNDIKKKSKKSLPPLLSKLSERRAERLNYLGTSFGLTNELLKFWKKNGYLPVYIRQTTSDLTGEHSCIMVKSIEEECSWINEFFYDFRKRFVNLLSYQFSKFKIPLPLNVIQNSSANLVGQLKELTKTQLECSISLYDLKRLEKYSNNLIDYHLIMDLLPSLAKLYFTTNLCRECNLSVAQLSILICFGLQHKTVDETAKELTLESSQVLGLFIRSIAKLTKHFRKIEEQTIESNLGFNQLNSTDKELNPLKESLRDEMNNMANEIDANLLSLKSGLANMDQYAVKGTDGDWQKKLKGQQGIQINSNKK